MQSSLPDRDQDHLYVNEVASSLPNPKRMDVALRLAATVILVRPSPDGLQVLLLRRSAKSAFMPGAFVFPGGAVDPGDYAHEPAQTQVDTRMAAAPRDAHALVRAAVRELFEEAGITVDAGTLRFFSHWVTPPGEPRRFDTYFFVAAAPPDAIGVADSVETHDARWLTPAQALEAARAGALLLFFPTIKHLERLAAFDDLDALLAFAREKPVVTIRPDQPATQAELPGTLEGRW
jgi:8-oxo-dGTP pyrophosphatase MutT (NUDIX family)